MAQRRPEVHQSLLLRQGDGNEEDGGFGVADGGSAAVSDITLSTFMVACIAFGNGCAVGYSSPTQSSIMQDLGLSVAEFSLFGSILSVGTILGAVICGKITDFLGRKSTMRILNLFYISGWLAIAFAEVPWLLDLGRLSLGFTNGISGYLAPIYIAEITTKNVRGRFVAIVPLMVCWGISFMYVVGSFVNWRTLALIVLRTSTIPGLIQLLVLFFIPESPRWLAKVGRDKELEAASLCLRGDKADISDEATEIKDFVGSLKSSSEEGNLDIFEKKYARPLLIVVGMLALVNLGGLNAFCILFWCISSMVGLVGLAAVQTVSGIFSTIVIDKSGRRPLLLVSSSGLCFSSFLVGLSFVLKEFHRWDQCSSVFALIGLLLFPINVKGSAGSLCNVIGSISGWFIAYYFNYLIKWNSAGTFFMFSAFCCANFVLTAAMVPETKGRTLGEIQASITRSSY
ncbi:Sugar transporter ERD6 14 isoform 3 [Hibiscus syriacus]|uniref:Sugar transporter ERD6 14 isoform 3 n=1 Tax=Hibiscus syriacus TaxID=106335 RepID=A0A6A2YXX7_HIBSY|nr:Sugar transporter ERD6 14 isoform 3 [Hibiscus syriacus]